MLQVNRQALNDSTRVGEFEVLPRISNHTLFIVSCGAQKTAERAPAKHLYGSPRFKKQIAFASSLGADIVIFSSKLGLIGPDDILDRYDTPLSALTGSEIDDLQLRCITELSARSRIRKYDSIALFSGLSGVEATNYEKFMLSVADSSGLPIVTFSGEQVDRALALTPQIRDRRQFIAAFYRAEGPFERLQGPFAFNKLPTNELPAAGVYMFTDTEEWSGIAGGFGRIVRIGTHGVSIGSKATLSQRLRAHYGLGSGAGNHRSSIFRLHVGECLIRAGLFTEPVPSWQRAVPSDSREKEMELQLEYAVSAYIRKLNLWWLEVSGPAHKNSRRSALESRLIRNLTGERLMIDAASDNWLGKHSSRDAISGSGLWNVQHVGTHVLPRSSQLELQLR